MDFYKIEKKRAFFVDLKTKMYYNFFIKVIERKDGHYEAYTYYSRHFLRWKMLADRGIAHVNGGLKQHQQKQCENRQNKYQKHSQKWMKMFLVIKR